MACAETETEKSKNSTSGIFLDSSSNRSDSEYGSELFLTPLLNSGRILEARQASKVDNISEIESYSGFLTVTVNRAYNSNLFFWFFPAAVDPENAPLLLWLQGGPGSSSLIGLFNENGPFYVDCDGDLHEREIGSWTTTHSVIYMDNPVGSGFSFTDSDDGYATCQDDISQDLHEALRQFYQIFPEFKNNDLYLAGQSYAGKYIPHLGVEIHKKNASIDGNSIQNGDGHQGQTTNPIRINLKGCIIGSTFTDPLIQLDWGEYLYNMGLLDDRERQNFNANTNQMRKLIQNQQYFEAFQIMQHEMFAFPPPIVSNYETITGFSNTCNLLEQNYSPSCFHYRKFLEKPSVRASIHVGRRNTNFGETKSTVFMKLAEDMPKSEKFQLETLLNEGYAILLYSSQFDVVVPHTAVDNLVRALSWSGRDKFLDTKREIWRVNNNNEAAGFLKEWQNLSYYFIRNAGHMAPTNQPGWCLDMVNRFTARSRELS